MTPTNSSGEDQGGAEGFRVLIYGSCVSRDTFELLPAGSRLLAYVARQSCISALAPAQGVLERLRALPSSFQDRMVRGDVRGNLVSVLERYAEQTDLLLMDLIDERGGVLELGGGYVTKLSEFWGAGGRELAARAPHLAFGTDEHFSAWSDAVGVLAGHLNRLGLRERTLVLQTPWASLTSDGSALSIPTWMTPPEEANRQYARYFDRIAELGLEILHLPDDLARSPLDHRWGPSPFHYTRSAHAYLGRRAADRFVCSAGARPDDDRVDAHAPMDLRLLTQAVRRRLPDGSSTSSRGRAQQFLATEVFETDRFGDVPYDGGRVWLDEADRSRSRYVHAFLFLNDWPQTALNGSQGPALARRAFAMTKLWFSHFPDRLASPGMAYHDETTAQRLNGHLAMLPAFEKHLSRNDLQWVRDLLDSTAELLSQADFHAGLNNHGMFQDLALVNYAGIAQWRSEQDRRRLLTVGLERLRLYFDSCFTSEGVHIENSPTYHVLVSRFVREHADLLSAIGHDDAQHYQGLMPKLVTYATHAVMPNGVFPPISDTSQTPLRYAAERVFGDPEFTYAASGGSAGRMPAARVLVLPRSGYAIYRSAWGDKNATFAFFTAAYNGPYHKHSDENSFFLRSCAVDLITEAGPYGYNYSDPLTKFGYSQYAHSTLIVNGASMSRTDEKSSEVSLELQELREDGFTVVGRNARLEHTVHERTLAVREVDECPRFDFLDTVASSRDQKYEILWNLGAGVLPILNDRGFELVHGGRKMLNADIEGDVDFKLSVHSAEKSPRYLGWRFPEFGRVEPGTVVRVSFSGQDAKVWTSFSLTAPEVDPALGLAVRCAIVGNTLTAIVMNPSAKQYCYRLFRGSLQVDELQYSGAASAVWTDLEPGRYRVRVHARESAGAASSAETTNAVVVPR